MGDDVDRLAEIERRLNLVELAVSELAGRAPVDTRGPLKTIHGIPVFLAPHVDDNIVREAIAELPAGLGAEDVVDRLADARLLVRKNPRR